MAARVATTSVFPRRGLVSVAVYKPTANSNCEFAVATHARPHSAQLRGALDRRKSLQLIRNGSFRRKGMIERVDPCLKRVKKMAGLATHGISEARRIRQADAEADHKTISRNTPRSFP